MIRRRLWVPLLSASLLLISCTIAFAQKEDSEKQPSHASRTGSRSIESPADMAIQSVVGKHRKLFNYYYQRVWRYNQKARGSIKIRIAIKDNGQIKHVDVLNDSVKISSLTSFILKHVRHWQFDPEHTAGSVVDLTFPFAPK